MTDLELRVRQVKNGYVVERVGPMEGIWVYETLDEVFKVMLGQFERRSESSPKQPHYGRVFVERG